MKELSDYEIMLWIKPYEYGLRVRDGVWLRQPPKQEEKEKDYKVLETYITNGGNGLLIYYYEELNRLRLEGAQAKQKLCFCPSYLR